MGPGPARTSHTLTRGRGGVGLFQVSYMDEPRNLVNGESVLGILQGLGLHVVLGDRNSTRGQIVGLNQINRKLAKLADQKAKLEEKMASYNPSDYEGLAVLSTEQKSIQDEIDELELRWMELSEVLE